MNRLLIFFFLLMLALPSFGQDQYTYVTDRAFHDPTDLIGYNFKPEVMEVPDESEDELAPGDYSFGISRNNLYVAGEDIQGVYNVNNINPTDYGYKLLLMNARNPTLQGHLKVILNKYAQAEALVFKRSTNDPEIIFFQAKIGKEMFNKEMEYFTDRWEVKLQSPDSLWGKTIYPFLRIHEDASGEQERLQAADSTSVTFVETIKVIEKVKKKKRTKSKKKKKQSKMENIELGIDEEAESEEEITDEAALAVVDSSMTDSLVTIADSLQLPSDNVKKKVKIIKEYFVNVRSILTYEDGSTEDKKWSFPIKKLVERDDDEAGVGEEKYQIEIATEKGGLVYLYLTDERTISSVEIMGKRYLMQGF